MQITLLHCCDSIVLLNRAFIAWEENITVDQTREHEERLLLVDYKDKLQFEGTVLPDPFSLNNWIGERDGMVQWPQLYFTDITDYLRNRTPDVLYHRLCNEYKEGKAYRLVHLGGYSVLPLFNFLIFI